MKVKFKPEQLELFALIKAECKENQTLYIVGGAVRDALFGCSVHDIDFALTENPYPLAKRLAKRLQAGYFVLDDERHTTRIAYYASTGRFAPLDFVRFTGADLIQDLRNRDFTINAIAIPLDDLNHVIDPFDGQKDIKNRTLRPTSVNALADDPLRVLRAIRFVTQFDLNFAPGLKKLIKETAPDLHRVSSERKRDEIFKTLEGSTPAFALQLYRQLNIFTSLFPAVFELENTLTQSQSALNAVDFAIKVVDYYHQILMGLSGQLVNNSEYWFLNDFLAECETYQEKMCSYFLNEITPGRKINALTYFSVLLRHFEWLSITHEKENDAITFDYNAKFQGEIAGAATKQFQLSNAEANWILKFTTQQLNLMPYFLSKGFPDRRTLHRFFKSTDVTGIALTIYPLALLLAKFDGNLERDIWIKAVKVAKLFFSAWWDNFDRIVSPPLLLNGYDLQQTFGIKPGKKIGDLLNLLAEEQASGTVQTISEAQTFLRKHI